MVRRPPPRARRRRMQGPTPAGRARRAAVRRSGRNTAPLCPAAREPSRGAGPAAVTSFGAQSTTDDVLEGVDLTGKRVLVTGASAGLGVRDRPGPRRPRRRRRERACATRPRPTPYLAAAGVDLDAVDLRTLDLASLARSGPSPTASSPTTTASTCSSPTPGSWPARRARPPTGSRRSSAPTTSATSCSSAACCPALLAAGAPRGRASRSAGHRFGDVDLDDPNFEQQPYDPWDGLRASRRRPTCCSPSSSTGGSATRASGPPPCTPAVIQTELGRHLTDETHRRRLAGARGRPADRGRSRCRRAPPRRCGRPRRRRRRGRRPLLRGLRRLAGDRRRRGVARRHALRRRPRPGACACGRARRSWSARPSTRDPLRRGGRDLRCRRRHPLPHGQGGGARRAARPGSTPTRSCRWWRLLSGTVPPGPHRRRLGDRVAKLDVAAARGEPDARDRRGRRRPRRAGRRRTGRARSAARDAVLVDLLERATGAEADFLRRLLTGELRQGALAGVMTDAVAKAAGVPAGGGAPGRDAVRRPAARSPPWRCTTGGRGARGRRAHASLHPVQPMLAASAADVAEAPRRAPAPASVEWKLDGARIQVHRARRRGAHLHPQPQRHHRPAARRRRRSCARFPAGRSCSTARRSASTRTTRPQRVPGHDERASAASTATAGAPAARPRFFDVLHLDGDDLIDQPLRRAPAPCSTRVVGAAGASPASSPPTPARPSAFLDEALAAGHEGVMVKALDSHLRRRPPGRRRGAR